MPGKLVRGKELTKVMRLYMRFTPVHDIAKTLGRHVNTIVAIVEREGWEPEREAIKAKVLQEIGGQEAEIMADDALWLGGFIQNVRKAIDGKDMADEKAADLVKWVLEGMKSRRELFAKPSPGSSTIQVNVQIVNALEEYERMSPEDRAKLRGEE